MELLTVDEVAKVLRVSVFTVRQLLKAGKLRGVKVGRQWRVRQTELDKYLAGE
ncbi:MAG: helix-turn-helix domain-containing protein [Chloroflexia bacterium]